LKTTATREVLGAASLSISRRLAARSGAMELTPVTLPPGRARLVTSPVATGSPGSSMTMGIEVVALLAAWAGGVDAVTMMSTLRRASSVARAERRPYCPSAYRRSKTTFCPSTQPNSRSDW
jgi:hypothetical protein